jgi:hypothetical protein
VPNVLKALRAEIRQMARNETKRASNPIREQIRDLRRTLTSIERRIAGLKAAPVGRSAPPRASSTLGADGRRARFAPALVRQHRDKLGLSRKAYAKLLGVSSLSIYFWETGRTHPRRDAVLAWQDLRKQGVRELRSKAGVDAVSGTARRATKRTTAAAPAKKKRSKKARSKVARIVRATKSPKKAKRVKKTRARRGIRAKAA